MNLKHKIYVMHVADSIRSYLLLLYMSMQCLFKLHLTLRGLGDNSCHLVESPLYLEDKGFSRPLQQY